MKKYYLGIDTSNYTTSVAAVGEDGKIIFDRRRVLKVKEGERGLRQSQALFEHICNLPDIISGLNAAAEAGEYELGGVGVSTRPRPVEGSYMPCFRAGVAVAGAIAEASGVLLIETSHQEGHLAAARADLNSDGYWEGFNKKTVYRECFSDGPNPGPLSGDFIAFHLSGGTTEAILCSYGADGKISIELAGGTKDISFGQLIDRVGVSLGIGFPCGKEIDRLALESVNNLKTGKNSENPFCKIKSENCFLNISGIETQIQRYIKTLEDSGKVPDRGIISRWLLERVAQALESAIDQVREKTGVREILLMGGVSSSEYIRKIIRKDDGLHFGRSELCSDNAVGVAKICAMYCSKGS